MIREERFVQSHGPYAVDLSSLRTAYAGTRHDGVPYSRADATAVWFRRRKGRTIACIGTLWDFQAPEPTTITEFLERHDDGRYGGECDGRWDGERYWGAQQPAVIERHLALLRPMLDNHPAVPAGYDGWWTFRTKGN